MSFVWPQTLYPLRDFLKKHGVEPDRHATARQAAYFSQQIVGSRIKFPPPGSDMMSTLLLIQQALAGPVTKSAPIGSKAVEISASGAVAKQAQKPGRKVAGKKGKSRPQPAYLTAFDPAVCRTGYHVFADGACVPNPGPGGWGVVAYKDGQEVYSDCGGDEAATNNTMELTAVLKAILWAKQYPTIAITIWTDSQYTCNGVNDWRHGWKRNGWCRGGPDAKPENRILMNADLWRSIDEELCDERASNIKVHWVKGHVGHLGNERADELAEIGRAAAAETRDTHAEDLDAEYRAVMAG